MSDTTLTNTQSTPPAADTGSTISKTAVSFIPLSAVKFSGTDAWIAYTRIGLYGLAGVSLWKKNKTLSYLFLGCAAISAGTSFMAGQ